MCGVCVCGGLGRLRLSVFVRVGGKGRAGLAEVGGMAEVLNPVSPLPASRRLSIAGNRCLPVNDDEAERAANRERRRSSVHGRRSTFGGKNGGRKEAGSQKMRYRWRAVQQR